MEKSQVEVVKERNSKVSNIWGSNITEETCKSFETAKLVVDAFANWVEHRVACLPHLCFQFLQFRLLLVRYVENMKSF